MDFNRTPVGSARLTWTRLCYSSDPNPLLNFHIMWHLVSRSLCDIGHLSLCLYCFAFLSPHPATSISSPMVPLVLLKHTKQYFISEIFTGHCLCFPNARITASRHYAWLLSLSFNGLTFKICIWCKSKVTLADSYLLSCQLFTARGWKECSILRRNNVWNNLCCALVFSRKKKKKTTMPTQV